MTRGGSKEESHVHVHRSEPLQCRAIRDRWKEIPVFTYLDAFCKDEYFAEFWPDYKNLDELKAHYQRGGLGDVKVKKFLNKVHSGGAGTNPCEKKRMGAEASGSIRNTERRKQKQPEAKAAETLQDVKAAMRINYFDDADFLN